MIIPSLQRLFSYLRKTLAAGENQFDCHPDVLVDKAVAKRRLVAVMGASWSMFWCFLVESSAESGIKSPERSTK
jgi:hypothetical protein